MSTPSLSSGEELKEEILSLDRQLFPAAAPDAPKVVHFDGAGNYNPAYRPAPPPPPPAPPPPPVLRPALKVPRLTIPAPTADSDATPTPPIPIPPPPPEHHTRRAFVLRRAVLGCLAIIGWCILALSLKSQTQDAWRRWSAPAPCQTSFPPGWPRDDLAQAFLYPEAACDDTTRTARRQALYPLYPLKTQLPRPVVLPGAPSNASAEIADHCQTHPDLPSVIERLLLDNELRLRTLTLVLDNKEINVGRLRYSMLQHAWAQGDDHLCAQHLGVPLCYCVMRVRDGPHHSHWEDMLGLVRMTCLSNQTMMARSAGDTLCGWPKDKLSIMYRFKNTCLQYHTPQNELLDRRFSKDRAAVAQQIYLLQRGLRSCAEDELAHGSDPTLGAIWSLYHSEEF